jgi:enterochelin esterase-like enzyme
VAVTAITAPEALLLEPQSTGLFVLLIVVFGGLTWWLVVTRQPVFRLLAACLAFIPAMLFGVVAVNKYYGYYQTWTAALADLTNQGATTGNTAPPPSIVTAGAATSGAQFSALTRNDTYLKLAQQQGYTLHLVVPGPRSHITRSVYVYLPPEYFQPSYKDYRFPVMELIHGQPGQPQDWINVVGVTDTLDHLVSQGHAKPVVLVMPDANGAQRVSLQCLNQAGGPQDLTYLAQDLPLAIAHRLRVEPPGPAWAVAGYSEGGFCAANMALRFPAKYGFSGVMSGYFKPSNNQLEFPLRQVSPFGRNRKLARQNTPLDEIRKLPPGTPIPQFWLGAGTGNKADVASAEVFWQELSLRQASVPLILTRGSGHDMTTWRAEVPAMLAWMTPRLAQAAAAEAAAHSPHPRPSGAPAAHHERHHRAKSPALAAQRARAAARHSS